MAAPSPVDALRATAVARRAGRLDVALKAIDHACRHAAASPELRAQIVGEAGELAAALAAQGAPLSSLSLWLRAHELGDRAAGGKVAELTAAYPRWRPEPGSIGVARDGLKAGASGAFAISTRQRGRILVLQGGITGDGTQEFGRVLKLAAQGVDWLFVDMQQLSYVGSAGLAQVVKVAENMANAGGGMSLFGLSSNLKILVETLGLADFLNPTGSLSESLGCVERR